MKIKKKQINKYLHFKSIAEIVMMGVVFFLIITPTSFFMKIIGKDLLKKQFKKEKKTYWLEREKTSSTMKRQF